jgi:hypothetical protein
MSFDLGQKKGKLFDLVGSLEQLKASSKNTSKRRFESTKQQIHFDHKRLLSSYYCGLDQEQVLIFKFNPFGKVQTWVQHFSTQEFSFPPPRKPQRVSQYHIREGALFWSLNLFGEPFHYHADLISDPKRPQNIKEQLILKSGPALFSPFNCQILAELL